MNNNLPIIAGLVVCAAALFPASVEACSCRAEALYRTIPGADARDVPIDIAPVLEGAFDPRTLKLTDDLGTTVEFTLALGPRVGCLGGWAELLPKQPLAPKTHYTIHANALYPDAVSSDQRIATLSFTTGEHELADEPLARPQLQAASLMRGAPDCGGVPSNMVCLGGLSPQKRDQVELLMRRGDEIVLRTTSFVQNDGSYALDKAPDCVEVRRRAIDGRRSEPVKICGEQLRASDFTPSELNEHGWLTCRDGLIGAAADRLAVDAGTPEATTDGDAGVDPSVDAPADTGRDAYDAYQRDAAAADSSKPKQPHTTGCAVSAPAPFHGTDLSLLLAMFLPFTAAKRRRPAQAPV